MKNQNPKFSTTLELLSLCLYVISLLVFVYIVLSYLIKIISPTNLFIDQQLFDLSYIRILLGMTIISGLSGWIILHSHKKILYASPWKLPTFEKILTISSGMMLAYVYSSAIRLPDVFSFILWMLFSAGFISLIGRLITFYSYYDISDIRFILNIPQMLLTKLYDLLRSKMKHTIQSQTLREKPKQYALVITKKQITILISIGVSSFLITLMAVIIVIIASKYATGQTIRENKLRKTFYISSIEPEHSTPGRTAKLSGYNFGFKTDKNYRVLTDDGIILEIVTWDKDFIEFIIPLSLPTGEHKIWIVRPTDELHREQGFRKSNKISLEVHSRFSLLPDVNDTKFDRGIKKIKRYFINKYPRLSPFIFYFLKYE